LFFKVYKKTNISVTNEIGLKYFGSIEIVVKEPKIAPINENINSFETISTLIFFDFQNLKELAIVDNVEETLFVPRATCGEKPTTKYAGREIKPPPPEIASTTAAIKQKTARIKNFTISNSIINIPP